MTPKQWLALFSFYISYLFFGASVFYLIEHKAEAENRAAEIQSRNDINGNIKLDAIPSNNDNNKIQFTQPTD